MDEKVIVLPNKENMLERLLKIDGSNHFQERFYPLLLEHAGEEKFIEGIVLMLVLAIHDYTENLPSIVSKLLYIRAPDFIDAFVDDAEISRQAKDILREALQASK